MKSKIAVVGAVLLLAPLGTQPAEAGVDLCLGVRGGVCWPRISESLDLQWKESTRSPTLGIFAEFGLNPTFSIQAELDYVRMSIAYWDLFFEPAKYVEGLDYLHVPVMFKARLIPGGKLVPVAAAGPVLGILLSADVKRFDFNGALIYKTLIRDVYRSFDVGAIVAVGIEVLMGGAKLVADVRYYQGLGDTRRSPNFVMKNAGLMLTGGVAF